VRLRCAGSERTNSASPFSEPWSNACQHLALSLSSCADPRLRVGNYDLYTLSHDGCTGSCGTGPFGRSRLIRLRKPSNSYRDASQLGGLYRTGAGDALEFAATLRVVSQLARPQGMLPHSEHSLVCHLHIVSRAKRSQSGWAAPLQGLIRQWGHIQRLQVQCKRILLRF
jgi:hypothetical protein